VADESKLDFETTASYSLTVEATDGTTPVTETVLITLNDINEAPTVNDQSFSIVENAANGTMVGSVVATDPNAGDDLIYAITAGNPGSGFTINATTGEITVNNSAALDYETNPNFSLTVEVTDSGTPGLSDAATVTVNLNDVNEAPIVNDQSFSIDENATNGMAVGTVAATDSDAGDGISYSIIAGNEETVFALDSETGEITVADSENLDYEKTSTYILTVQVEDSGSLAGKATITIHVTDVENTSTHNDDDTVFDVINAIDTTDPTSDTSTSSYNAADDISDQETDTWEPIESPSGSNITVVDKLQPLYTPPQPPDLILSVIDSMEPDGNIAVSGMNQRWMDSTRSSREAISAPARAVMNNKEMLRELDLMNEQISKQTDSYEEQGKLIVGTAAGLGVIIGGFIIWMLRGVSMLSSVLATVPMWRFFDALPVLSKWEESRSGAKAAGKDEDEDVDEEEKTLQDIFDFKQAPRADRVKRGKQT
jgi:hypothetical protein